ncbi:MFS general substrate transporter [Polychaeton citri CBS 116435]|uniref:MFS general substrate transporter n=1 Tax=Polychaeton citri CBS 116435 TaxID=1314669 RepID=A0A9P4Q7Y7_9PEZI|nr:MFS general substrate transporter [Polychaeton citri CBS 116435]
MSRQSSNTPQPTDPLPSAAAHTKPTLLQRQSSTFRYYTFPHAPPRHVGADSKRPNTDNKMKDDGAPTGATTSPAARRVLQQDERSSSRGSPGSGHYHHHSHVEETPLPTRQLAILAVIALAEQTALNSISPYLPDMASTFPGVEKGEVGLYVGLIASAFALAQFATNFLWGWLSDRVGRKPIVLTGTLLTAACFVAFGFCRTLWQAVVVQAMMGLVNGNAGVISTCLGEITDRSNQSRAFTYLPVIYGLGGITGPIVGGLLVFPMNPFKPDQKNPYPYLAPNLVSAVVLVVDFVLTMIFLEESLQEARNLPPFQKRVGNLFSWIWQFTTSHRPTYMRHGKRTQKKHQQHKNGSSALANGNNVASDDGPCEDDEDTASLSSSSSSTHETTSLLRNLSDVGVHPNLPASKVFNRDTILLLITFLIFQLSNISFNSLYPIFAQGPPPTGRDLNPEEIGVSLAFAGVITILFQIGIFGRLREKVGNKTSYRIGLAGFVVAFLLMPWVGYKDPDSTSSRVWLWIELGVALIIKTVAAVGGLTSALLLITNSAPSHAVLGTLNGLAQTLSAAGRAVGPFISGSLYTASTHVRPKGEALAFGIFAGIAFLGFLMSFGIRGADLEAEGWDEEEGGSEDDEDDDNEEDESSSAESERRQQDRSYGTTGR